MMDVMVDKQWIDDHCMSECRASNGDRKLISKWAKAELWYKRGFGAELQCVMRQGKPTIVECLHAVYHPERDGLCVECGNPCNFHTFSLGYYEYCSKQCAIHSKTRAKKISTTSKASPKHAAAREKIKQGNIKKYGVPYYYQTDEFKQKAAKAKFELHGDPYWNNPEANEATCMEKYGARSLMCLPEFQKRMQRIILDKYGKAFPGVETHSAGENSMREAIEVATGKAWPSNYGTLPHGLELDGYCRELNAAFEYCGLFWHSSQYKHRMYHRLKLNECKKLGIRLFTVFEDEWLERGSQVVEFIASSVGIFSEFIGARKCTLKVCEYSDPSFRDVNAFIAENHIQRSSSRSRMCVALRYHGSIVAAASFGPHPRNEGIVLNRLVFKPRTQVVGAISRIVKAADKFYDGKNIDTWSDSRWSEGNGYAKAGLKMTREYFVDYSYVKAGRRITKQSMKKKDSGCPPGMTEREYCENVLGLYRLYDCGKKRWSTHRDKT
jgi:hypothetical protein